MEPLSEVSKRASPEVEDYMDDTPFHLQRPFGSGLKRKRVAFVPASSGGLTTTAQATLAEKPSERIGDVYLRTVLSRSSSQDPPKTDGAIASAGSTPPKEQEPPPRILCEVCNLPLPPPEPEQLSSSEPASDDAEPRRYPPNRHAASLAHQVCLAHSHPPSALDRSRMGLAYLRSRGWDPDARQGLGAAGQGIVYPLKARRKDDTLGVGVVVPKDVMAWKKEKEKEEEKVRTLDARAMRKKVAEDRRKMERLRKQMFGSVDVEKYLGSVEDG